MIKEKSPELKTALALSDANYHYLNIPPTLSRQLILLNDFLMAPDVLCKSFTDGTILFEGPDTVGGNHLGSRSLSLCKKFNRLVKDINQNLSSISFAENAEFFKAVGDLLCKALKEMQKQSFTLVVLAPVRNLLRDLSNAFNTAIVNKDVKMLLSFEPQAQTFPFSEIPSFSASIQISCSDTVDYFVNTSKFAETLYNQICADFKEAQNCIRSSNVTVKKEAKNSTHSSTVTVNADDLSNLLMEVQNLKAKVQSLSGEVQDLKVALNQAQESANQQSQTDARQGPSFKLFGGSPT